MVERKEHARFKLTRQVDGEVFFHTKRGIGTIDYKLLGIVKFGTQPSGLVAVDARWCHGANIALNVTFCRGKP